MNVEQLTEQLYNNLSTLLSPISYKSLLNRANNLNSFDVINRLLIEMQSKKSFEIRTEEDWDMHGRLLNKRAKPIYIILPKYSYRYTNKETGEILVDTDLNSNEILKALQYGIIEKTEVIENVYSLPMYDIRDTVSKGDIEYKVTKPNISARGLMELFTNITGATIEKCDESYYSKSCNTLFINNKSHKELVISVATGLTSYYTHNRISNIIAEISEDKLLEYNKQLLNDSIQYAICTLLGVDIDITFDVVIHTSNNTLINILNIVDNIIFEISNYLEFNTEYNFKDAISSINMLRKSEALLSILEANDILNKMKGA